MLLSLFNANKTGNQGSNFIAATVEGEQNAVDHCGNDGNFLPYIVQLLKVRKSQKMRKSLF